MIFGSTTLQQFVWMKCDIKAASELSSKPLLISLKQKMQKSIIKCPQKTTKAASSVMCKHFYSTPDVSWQNSH